MKKLFLALFLLLLLAAAGFLAYRILSERALDRELEAHPGETLSHALAQKPSGIIYPSVSKTFPSSILQACSIGFSNNSMRSS